MADLGESLGAAEVRRYRSHAEAVRAAAARRLRCQQCGEQLVDDDGSSWLYCPSCNWCPDCPHES